MKKNKIERKYTDKEQAESFVFRTKLTAAQKAESDALMFEMREQMRKNATPKQLLLSRLLQLKYQIEDYLANPTYDAQLSFGFFLRGYLNTLEKKDKEFAEDIDIAPTKLSQYIHNRLKPSEKVIIRLEIHSNKIIPAIIWYKLLEKQEEYKILTNNQLRIQEKQHVRNMVMV